LLAEYGHKLAGVVSWGSTPSLWKQILVAGMEGFKRKRLKKDKKQIELIKKIFNAIERDDSILARKHIKVLEIVSLKLTVG
jgi:hypothetical protein